MKDFILRRIQIILLSCIVMLMLAACGGDAPPDPTQPPAVDVNAQSADSTNTTEQDTTSAQTVDTNAPDTVASVNGIPITQSEFDRAFVRIAGNSAAADNTALSVQVLNTLIEQEVIAQAAEQLGMGVSDADVTAEIDSLKSSLTTTTWEEWLASNQYTEDELRDAIENSIVTNRVRDNVIEQLGEAVEHVHARHILVATADEAQDVLNRLAGGEAFEQLAAEVSLDVTTRDFGGDLGWFIREELLDVTLAETAFSIGEGEIAGPVVTRLGYHIIQTLEKEERIIEQERMPLLVENVFNRWLEEEILSANIVRNQ